MVELNDNEIKVGDNKIGPNTIVQVNLKTLFVLIGVILSGMTGLYMNMKSTADKSATQINDLAKELRELKDQDLKELNRMVYEIDGKVEGIYRGLERNSNYRPTGQIIHNQTPQSPSR